MICLKCQKQNEDDAKFCVYCGANMVSGTEVKETAKLGKRSNKFIVIALVVVALIAALIFFTGEHSITGTYASVKNPNGFNILYQGPNAIHTITIKDDKNFTMHDFNDDSSSGDFIKMNDIPVDNAGTYVIKDGNIFFSYSAHLILGETPINFSCTLVPNGFDCASYQYRKSK